MLANLAHTAFPHPLLALLIAVAGAACGAALTYLAARRTLTRPLALALTDETTLLAGVLSDLRRYPYLANISPTDFAAGTHHRIWSALQQALGAAAVVSAEATDEDCEQLGHTLAARQVAILDDARAILANGVAPATDLARLAQLSAHHSDTTTDTDPATDPATGAEQERARRDAATVTAAEAVLAAGNDRNRLSGAGLVLPTKSPDSTDPAHPPLERVYVPPTMWRTVITSALTAMVASLFPGVLAATSLHGAAVAAGALSLAALLAMSVVVSLVDLDTLYIDMRTWVVGTIASWAAVTAAALLASDPMRLLAGVGLVVATAVIFEGSNLVFKLVRGMDGQGFGDTLIIVATVGAPTALTGDARVGYWSVMGGLLAAIAGWVAGRVAGKVTRHSPFAFGPWLAAGWVIALVVYLGSVSLTA